MDLHATQPPILIIGGGLAGLALAQGLLSSSPPIPFHIFERDSLAASRPQGYRIRISASALHALLPSSVFAAFTATSNSNILPGHAIDALTGEPDPGASMPGPPPGGSSPAQMYNADRAVLREVLLHGLEEHVSYGKKFASYEILSDGTAEVRFDDGSTARGALLVGADGVRSAVRRQLLPGFPLVDTEGRSVFGKTLLTPTLTARLPASFLSGMCLASVPNTTPPAKLLFEAMRFDPTAAATHKISVPEDYIYWVLCTRNDVTDIHVPVGLPALLSLSGEASAQLAQAVMRDWHDSLLSLAAGDDSSTATLAFFSCTKDGLPQSWEQLRRETADVPVTLIGDAAHPMPPVGGVGANSAFEDALELCEALRVVAATGGYGAALAQYERSMVQRVGQAIERSSYGATRFFGMKPVDELKPIEI